MYSKCMVFCKNGIILFLGKILTRGIFSNNKESCLNTIFIKCIKYGRSKSTRAVIKSQIYYLLSILLCINGNLIVLVISKHIRIFGGFFLRCGWSFSSSLFFIICCFFCIRCGLSIRRSCSISCSFDCRTGISFFFTA